MMLTYAIVVLAIAAAGGILLALKVLRGELAPWPLSILHALLGAVGLALIIAAAYYGADGGFALLALGLLLGAALGGFVLASFHFRQRPAPKLLVITHAMFAVAGFAALLLAVVGLP